MAGSVNKAIIIGHLGKDPEVRTTQNGSKVASFSIATSESWKNRNGEKQEKTEWHRVVVWNDHLVDVVDKYLKKGSPVYVEGKLRTRKYTDQSGVEKYTTEITVENFSGSITLLGGKDGNEQSPKTSAAQHKAAKEGWEPPPDMDDEIPF